MTDTEKALQHQIDQLTLECDLLRKKCQQSDEAYAVLMDQLKQMLRHRFGQKSERYIDLDNPQLSLYGEVILDATLDEEDEDSEGSCNNDIERQRKRRAKKSKNTFAAHLSRTEQLIPVDAHRKTCQCGCQKNVISHERHERLNYQPPVYEVIVELREVVACPKGCAGEVITADKPKYILPKASFTESVLAHIIVSKLDDRQPYYHLEKQFEKRAGFRLSRQTMARSVIDCSDSLQPLINLMKDEVIDYDVGALDATTLQVLNEPGRSATTKSYAYCFRGGAPGKDVILYEYNAIKHKPFVNNWFAGFSGTLHCDGDPFFDLLFESEAVSPSFCNTHARRKFEPIAIASKGNGLAKQAMRFYKRLYKIERKAKDEKMSPEQRYNLRQQRSKPLMAEFKQWLDEHYPTVPPESSLGKAFAYTLKFWDGLCEFLNDGRLEADNNLTEQEIKPFVIARKNFILRFHRVNAPTASELNTLVATISQRIAVHLERQGLLARDDESSYLTLDLQNDDAMNQLQGHSITYRIAVGPQQGRKVFTLQTIPSWEDDDFGTNQIGKIAGFSLHAGVATKTRERRKLERLCRYISRPAVSEKRLALTSQGKVRYQLKTPYRDGTTHIIFEPLDFMAKLAALVPKPRANLTRYHGVLVGMPHHPNSKQRIYVTPAKRGKGNTQKQGVKADEPAPVDCHQSMTWAERLKRVFNIDIA